MNIAAAISHKEQPLVGVWSQWIAALGLPKGVTFHITFHPKVKQGIRQTVLDNLGEVSTVTAAEFEGTDPGYPGGANQMFIQTARRAAKAGKPFLWMETDLIPTRKGWFEEIMDEYATCGKPFLGPVMKVFDTPHVNGTAVYHPDWETLTNITSCPNWNPWDTWCRKTMFPLAADSKLIRHFYGNKTFPLDAHRLSGVAAFHPCKDGSLIFHLNQTCKLLDPSVFDVEPVMAVFDGYRQELSKFKIVRCAVSGAAWYICRLFDLRSIAELFRIGGGFRLIDEDEYQQLTRFAQ
jgi:hypothetical protein